MTIKEAVNKVIGQMVRVQTTNCGYTQFISSSEICNELMLGRIRDYPVDHIEEYDDNNKKIVHIYGKNYLDYSF